MTPADGLRKTWAGRRWLVSEAFLYLVWARAMLFALPFRYLTRLFGRHPSRGNLDALNHEQMRDDVRWAILRTADLLPGKTTCFPRAMAAQAMCLRRGIPAVLNYGASPSGETGVTAHVWVMDNTEGVVGHEIASSYRIIARFPS
jgi:hypothetical protein